MSARNAIHKVLVETYGNPDPYMDWELSDADAIITGLRDAGLVIVPIKPTMEMAEAALKAASSPETTIHSIWIALLTASKENT